MLSGYAKQREYAMQRADSIEMAKLKDAEVRHTTKGHCLNDEQRLVALLAGTLPRATGKKGSCLTGLNDYTDVSSIWNIHGLDVPDKLDQVNYDKECKFISQAATRLRDMIMLGDFETAERMLTDFSEGKY